MVFFKCINFIKNIDINVYRCLGSWLYWATYKIHISLCIISIYVLTKSLFCSCFCS